MKINTIFLLFLPNSISYFTFGVLKFNYMNYYIDTEFLEGTQKENFPISLFRKNTPPTIDLISIGIVSEEGREYYAISKDFNLEEAWNRYDLKENTYRVGFSYETKIEIEKVYWIRENVLKPIWEDYLKNQQSIYEKTYHWELTSEFSYRTMKTIIRWIGKTNKQIAEEIISFTTQARWQDNPNGKFNVGTDLSNEVSKKDLVWDKPKLYAYYADYDWVAFCWLFGKMMDLPNGFPMYCRDLKQILDEKELARQDGPDMAKLRDLPTYPKQENEHNALDDARWNKKLHEFLNSF